MYDYLKTVYKEVAAEFNLPYTTVKIMYESSWEFIKEKIEAMPLNSDKIYSKEEFDKIRPCFNLPSLGKLGCEYNRYVYLKEDFIKQQKKNE